MRKDNKGFSLVELLVTIAIFSIIIVSITSFMVIGSKTFAKGNAEANIQREAQLVINQIGDMIIDSTGAVEFKESASDKELIMYGVIDGDQVKESVKWTKDSQQITYSKWTMVYNPSTDDFDVDTLIVDNELLAEKVVNFYADLSDTRDEYDKEGDLYKVIQSVKLSAEYKDDYGNTEYATTPVITIRNRMISGNAKMVYEETERPPETVLSVDVHVEHHSFYPLGWNSTNTATIPARHKLEVRSIITKAGYEEGDITYEWSVTPGWASIESSSPTECVILVYDEIWDKHLGESIIVTQVARGNDGKVAQDSDSRILYNEDYGDDQLRGRVSTEQYYHINPDASKPEYDAEDFEISIRDEAGNIFPNSDQLVKDYFSQTTIDKGGIKLNIANGLDANQEYFVHVKVKCSNNKEITRTFYIPRVSINPLKSECIWTRWEDNYGDAGTGDGISYYVEGYLREAWDQNQPYDVELMDDYQVDNLPKGWKLHLTKKQATTSDKHEHGQKLTFNLSVTDDKGKPVSTKRLNKLKVKVRNINVKMTITDLENVSGIIPITFKHPEEKK